ncbi:MAG: SDR family NAD(P)-dependent oxidoreductase [Gammaproteobacteria bacterium]
MSAFELTGKVAIVTGGGVGIGRGIALAMAKAGATVVVCGRTRATLEETAAQVRAAGGSVHVEPFDLTDRAQVERAVEAIIARCGRIDIVVNNAMARATISHRPIAETTEEDVLVSMRSGPMAALALMQCCLPQLKENRGRVINVGSGAGVEGYATFSSYAMAKAALHVLTKLAAREWGQHGITVNGILPIAMTDRLEQALREDPDAMKPFIPPLGRFGDSEADIGSVAVFLASEAGSYITGQNIPVDGGTLMMR